MSKFKVGDRIRVNEKSGFSRGSYGTVIEDKRQRDPRMMPLPEGAVNVKRDFAAEDDCVFFFESELDLLESSTPQTSKYKAGDVVVLTDAATLNHMTSRVKIVSSLGSECYQVCQIFKEDDVWKICETEINHEATTKLQTSNEKPSFVSFFTSVIVAKNKDVSDIGELLYDENTTKISLEDEGGGAFLILEQDYNGAIQQIRLDIDEVDTVFSAIKQLVNQLEGVK